MWVDNWGVATGNIIRIAMILVGILMLVLRGGSADAYIKEELE